MREIKFRAWNSHMEQMDYSVYTMFGSENGLNSVNDHFRYAENIGFKWMQYTGLKDKNGVEIYEGDVVRYDDGEEYTDFSVEFSEGAYWLMEGPSTCSRLKREDKQEIEVIGNIYENPELLEKR